MLWTYDSLNWALDLFDNHKSEQIAAQAISNWCMSANLQASVMSTTENQYLSCLQQQL